MLQPLLFKTKKLQHNPTLLFGQILQVLPAYTQFPCDAQILKKRMSAKLFVPETACVLANKKTGAREISCKMFDTSDEAQ